VHKQEQQIKGHHQEEACRWECQEPKDWPKCIFVFLVCFRFGFGFGALVFNSRGENGTMSSSSRMFSSSISFLSSSSSFFFAFLAWALASARPLPPSFVWEEFWGFFCVCEGPGPIFEGLEEAPWLLGFPLDPPFWTAPFPFLVSPFEGYSWVG